MFVIFMGRPATAFILYETSTDRVQREIQIGTSDVLGRPFLNPIFLYQMSVNPQDQRKRQSRQNFPGSVERVVWGLLRNYNYRI